MTSTTSGLRMDYVEFVTSDLVTTKNFYAAAFGWVFTDYGPEYTSFHDGRLAGGFVVSLTPPVPTNPLVVLFAPDLEDALRRVRDAGGRITREPFDFPGGRRFQFRDPNGLELAVWSDRRVDGTTLT